MVQTSIEIFKEIILHANNARITVRKFDSIDGKIVLSHFDDSKKTHKFEFKEKMTKLDFKARCLKVINEVSDLYSSSQIEPETEAVEVSSQLNLTFAR